MTEIREWSASICAAALAVSVLQYLFPGSAMDKILRMVLGVFFLCAMVLPLKGMVRHISWELPGTSETQAAAQSFSDEVDRQREDAIRSSVASLVAKELSPRGISCENIEVETDRNEDGSIVINKVTVVLPRGEKSRCGEAAAALKKDLELETEVTVDGG